MTQIVDEMQVIFEQNVISEFFLQQPLSYYCGGRKHSRRN